MEWINAFICLTLCISFCAVQVASLDCYECNLNLCSREVDGKPDPNESEECKKFHEAMAMNNLTARTSALDKLDQTYKTCEPVLKNNCRACMKIDTTASYISTMGKQMFSRVISKVCALELPNTREDDCDSRGPKYAPSIVCVCYGDNCNTGTRLSLASLTSFAIIMAMFKLY